MYLGQFPPEMPSTGNMFPQGGGGGGGVGRLLAIASTPRKASERFPNAPGEWEVPGPRPPAVPLIECTT